MATLTYTPYQGGQIHAERTNEYIANGHGDEVMVRTNRYIAGDHACGNRCLGVGCPSDPQLASELMETLRAKYEYNLAGKKTKGARDDTEGAAHYQFVLSWPPEEPVSSAERYDIAVSLIQRSKLKDHANLIAPHENKPHDHLHISTSAFSIDGTRKLCLNNRLLYSLRRELDYICVERGLSIVEAPELWGDKAYKKWFDEVKASGIVTVHPPLPKEKKKKTQKEQYADAKKEERKKHEELMEELAKPRKVTEENRGTDFYGLPHIYHPRSDGRAQLYIYALDKEGNRRPPLELDLSLQMVWARSCGKEMDAMPDFRGKREIRRRITWAQKNAEVGLDLISKLDIGTRAELEAHRKAVGSDISKYKQEIARQDKILSAPQNGANTAKLERARARKEKAEENLKARKAEYRALKRTASVLDSMDNAEHWQVFRQRLIDGSGKKVDPRAYVDHVVIRGLREVGQVLDIPREEIDQIITEAKRATPISLEEQWLPQKRKAYAIYTKRKMGLSAMYDCIRDEYAERRRLRAIWYTYNRHFPVAGPVTALLHMLISLLFAFVTINKEREVEHRVAKIRRVAEEIRWHNQNCEDQLKRAKTRLAIALMDYSAGSADQAWMDFYAECDRIMARTRQLQLAEAAIAGDRMDRSSVKDLQKEIDKTKAIHETSSLDDLLKNAQGRADTKKTSQKEKERPR